MQSSYDIDKNTKIYGYKFHSPACKSAKMDVNESHT